MLFIVYVFYFIGGAFIGMIATVLFVTMGLIGINATIPTVIICGLLALLLGSFIHNASDRPIGE